jgi:hypothetical protein
MALRARRWLVILIALVAGFGAGYYYRLDTTKPIRIEITCKPVEHYT